MTFYFQPEQKLEILSNSGKMFDEYLLDCLTSFKFVLNIIAIVILIKHTTFLLELLQHPCI